MSLTDEMDVSLEGEREGERVNDILTLTRLFIFAKGGGGMIKRGANEVNYKERRR
jgi:hypothetical protein